MKLTPWQKELIGKYESMTGLDVINKEEIHDNKSFWEVWDANKRWFEDLVGEVQNVDNEYLVYKYEEQEAAQ